MAVFSCVRCGAALTVPVSRVPLPASAGQTVGNGVEVPVLMAPGTYALDPGPEHGTVVLPPGAVHGTSLILDRPGLDCCGISGREGPNLACGGCGLPVGTRTDACSVWQTSALDAEAVRVTPGAETEGELPVPGWDEVVTGPVPPEWEPVVPRWGDSRPGADTEMWNPRWEAEIAVTLAHLVIASDGVPVTMPDGLAHEVTASALRRLLPRGRGGRLPLRAALAGPGRPLADHAALALAPTHPQTGEVWRPRESVLPAVPVAAEVWKVLARGPVAERRFPPLAGDLLESVLDDAGPGTPLVPFTPDRRVFLHALEGGQAVRRP